MTDAVAAVSPHDWQEATIERIVAETPTVKSFVLRPRVFQPFLAGQHVEVRLTAPDGYAAHRSYSICSSPTVTGTIQLAIEELATGEVSPYFHEVAQVGDVVDIRGPFTTHFAWRPFEHGDVLLLGGGSGIAPLVSMLRLRAELAQADSPHAEFPHAEFPHAEFPHAELPHAELPHAESSPSDPPSPHAHIPRLTLVYSARTWNDVIFRDELLRAEQTQQGLRVLFCLTRDAAPSPTGRVADFTRRLDTTAVQYILNSMPTLPNTCFVCGNNSFAGAIADALVHAGIPPHAVRTERYGG